MKSMRWIITYAVAASVGLWFAFFLSLKFVTPAHSQQSGVQALPPPPSAGELPPEFTQEAPQNGNSSGAAIPPPPSEPPPGLEAPPQVPAQPPAPGVAVPEQIPPMQMESVAPIIPQFADDDKYVYDPSGRRDPFKPYRGYRPAVPGGAAVTDPLQKWELSRFVLVAIMWEIRNPRAMVKDPDGKLYMINKSSKIGLNNGKVVAIREGEVVVVETIDNEGVVTREVKVLELKK